MQNKFDADAQMLKTRSSESIAAALSAIKEAQSASRLAVMRASEDFHQAETDAAASRERARTQTRGADQKIDAAHRRALEEETKARRLKNIASAIRLHAAETSKDAATARQQQQEAAVAGRAAEERFVATKARAVEIEKGWKDRLEKARESLHNTSSELASSKGSLWHMGEIMPRTEALAENAEDELRKMKLKVQDSANQAHEEVKKAKAEAAAENSKARAAAHVVQIENEAMVTRVQDEMAHKIKMEQLASETKQYIAHNNAKIQVVNVVRDGKLEIIDHNATMAAADLRHETVVARKEHHLLRAKAAEQDKLAFQTSATQHIKLSDELDALHNSDGSTQQDLESNVEESSSNNPTEFK
jgi:hypothetical protein